MNLQDGVLNQVRKENVEVRVVLIGGAELTGNVKGFDNFTVVLAAGDQQHLIYKHAIAHIQQSRGANQADDWKFGIEAPKNRPRGGKRPPGGGKPAQGAQRIDAATHAETGENKGHSNRGNSSREASKGHESKVDTKRSETFNSLDFSKVQLPDEV